MDQVKKFLKIAVAQRFWILCTVAALVPMIAYFMGNGKIVTQTDAKAKDIESAYKGVDPYKSGKLPNPEWKSLADAKTAKLTEEINIAWKKLYERQAPLLRWPLDRVEEKFRAWGRRHPEAKEASPDDIQLVIQDYVNFHPEYVTSIYKSFRPFDFEKGDGVIISPPEAALLRPAKFEISKAPKLGAIWKEQEKLWVSQAVLAVVNEVNKSAKTWDQAPIKQIVRLEVAADDALDPMSKTKGVTLVDAPAILAPGEEAAPVEEAAGGMGGMMSQAGYGAPGGMGGMGGKGDRMGMDGMMGGGAGGIGGGTKTAPDIVKFLAPPEGVENPPYFIVPILLTTLIDQDRIPELLVELENSPMAIQVMSLDLSKPSIKVQKPEKGNTSMLGYGGMTGMMGMMGGMGRGRGGMDGMEGMMGGGMMGGMMGGPGMGGGRGGMDGMEGMMGGMMGGAGGQDKKGTDVRGKDRRKERETAEKNLAKRARMSLQDPYYNVVEVSVYGQARFYNPPPPPTPKESEGDAAAAPAEGEAKPADAAKKEEPKADEAKKDEPKAESKADEAKKDAPKADAKAEEAKPEAGEKPAADAAKQEPKPAAGEKPAQAPKTDAPKADAPK